MNRSATFGVIGGSGSTGKTVAKELRSSTDRAIFIGGRNLASLEAVAAVLGAAVSAVRVDVHDPQSLEEFCGRCSVVVNCGGPVSELHDMVAQAALRTRSHYVDVAGLTLVREGMMRYDQELSDLGLACVVSAGWLPGMTELLPAYSLAVAKTRMNAIHSLAILLAIPESGRIPRCATLSGTCASLVAVDRGTSTMANEFAQNCLRS
jgi:saccharopine dehydrogenase-like NADP-dependent oxidoreductase